MKQKKLGDANILCLAEARNPATKRKAQIAVNGHDPVQEQKILHTIPTLESLTRELILPYAQQIKRSWASDRAHLEHHILPAFGKRYLDTLTTAKVVAWLDGKKKAGYAPAILNRMLGLVNWVYRKGAERNPARGIPLLLVHNHREVILTEEQICHLMQALDDSLNRELKPFEQLSSLLGTRKQEQVRSWGPDATAVSGAPYLAKNGKERFIPLSQTAIGILETLPRHPGCPWLLPNPKTRQPYASYYHAWDTSRGLAGVLPGAGMICDIRPRP